MAHSSPNIRGECLDSDPEYGVRTSIWHDLGIGTSLHHSDGELLGPYRDIFGMASAHKYQSNPKDAPPDLILLQKSRFPLPEFLSCVTLCLRKELDCTMGQDWSSGAGPAQNGGLQEALQLGQPPRSASSKGIKSLRQAAPDSKSSRPSPIACALMGAAADAEDFLPSAQVGSHTLSQSVLVFSLIAMPIHTEIPPPFFPFWPEN